MTIPEVLSVLKSGYHEAQKDEWKPEHLDWNYAIRGKTLDGRELRIPIAIKNGVVIVTAIDLSKKEKKLH